jgi:hypothetical protein
VSEKNGRQTLNVDLGELRPLLDAAAKNQGKRPAALVRDAVAQALAVPAAPSTRASPRRRGRRWLTATFRLSADEADALEAGALAEGVSKAEHVGRLALAFDAGVTRLQVLDALHGLGERLQALELVLQQRQPGQGTVAALREVRAQSRRVSGMVEAVSATRRTGARR